MKSADLYLAKN